MFSGTKFISTQSEYKEFTDDYLSTLFLEKVLSILGIGSCLYCFVWIITWLFIFIEWWWIDELFKLSSLFKLISTYFLNYMSSINCSRLKLQRERELNTNVLHTFFSYSSASFSSKANINFYLFFNSSACFCYRSIHSTTSS